MKHAKFAIPLCVFVIIGVYLGTGLKNDPRKMPVMLQGEKIPEFSLKPISGRDEKGFTNTDLIGSVSLLNFWGSWCVSCKLEHPFLMKIKAAGLVPINGIDWREKTPSAGLQWLQKFGDPYKMVGIDPKSKTAIAFGVTGAPETFIIDSNGVIRFKHTGPLNQAVWDETIFPTILMLKKEKLHE